MQLKCFLFGLALVTMLVVSNSAYGCQCMSEGTSCQAFGKAAAVFVGTVTAVNVAPQIRGGDSNEINWTPRTFKFLVEQSFLGVEGTEVEVALGWAVAIAVTASSPVNDILSTLIVPTRPIG